MTKRTTIFSCLLAITIAVSAQSARFNAQKTGAKNQLQSKATTATLQRVKATQIAINDPATAHTKGTNMLKASKVAQAAPTSLFKRPAGTYIPSFIGNADPQYLGYSYTYAGIFGSGYSVPWTFRNTSAGATGYVWSWGETTNFSTDANAVLTDEGENYLSAGMYYAPSLKAGNGPDSTTYTLPNNDEESAFLFASSDVMYVGNADYYGNASQVGTNGISLSLVSANGGTGLSGAGKGYYWGSCLRNADGANGTKVQSIVSVYEKPQSPLTIKDICYFGDSESTTPVPADKNLTATIVKLNANGELTTDTIATATIAGSDVIVDEYGVYLSFTFTEIDPETGREAPVTPVITDAFAIILSDLSQPGINIGLLSDYNNTLESTSYYTKVDAVTGASDGYMYKSSTTGMNIYLNMNAYFNYIYTSPESNVLVAPAAGGEALDADGYEGAAVYTFHYDVTDSLTNEDLIWLKDELPEWLELGYSNEYYADYGILIFYFTAKPLPIDVTTRSVDVTLQSIGAEGKITIKQEDVNAVNSPKVSLVRTIPTSNGYNLRYPSSYTQLKVINTAGQTVDKQALPTSGNFTYQTSQLAKGIYFLRFEGSKTETVKIVK